MSSPSRRAFLQTTSAIAGASLGTQTLPVIAQVPGERPKQDDAVEVLNPRNRVPLSFIIDDSCALVNLAYFGIPQFHETFPDKYLQPWRELPHEIPDTFVRKFAEWCNDHGVKGKYSVVPYPACTGWVDRFIPGWSKQELKDSLKLIREELPQDWDFHPEMISHTRVIDTKTGRPYEDHSEYFMENWRWTDGKSVDQLADYIAYALQILKNADIPCEGMTTPGGFGNRVLPEISKATLQACKSVFNAEIPHYFRHLYTDDTSVVPRVENASGLDTGNPECVVSIIGCTGDWFGGWDGLVIGSVDKFITEDLSKGRMVEVIEKGEPAIMVCHWPGIYFNGHEIGFNIFKEVVTRCHQKYDHLIWMKLSEISRYWAAKELTTITRNENKINLKAPFASPIYTLKISGAQNKVPTFTQNRKKTELKEVNRSLDLQNNTWTREGDDILVCFDLPKGESTITLS